MVNIEVKPVAGTVMLATGVGVLPGVNGANTATL
jgi:hypothetical protein